MQIVTSTSDLIFDKPDIVEWRNDEVLLWIKHIGLEKYAPNFSEINFDGIQLIKCNPYDFKNKFGVRDMKDLKLLLNSIDFLRIFVKLRKDCFDFIEIDKINEYNDHRIIDKNMQENNLVINTIEEEFKEANTNENLSISNKTISKKNLEKVNEKEDTLKIIENSEIKEDSKNENNNNNSLLINNNPGFYITKLSISNKFFIKRKCYCIA